MGLILNRRRELGYILPYDTEIEYLESSGTQCIDTLVQLYTGEEATYEIDIKAYQPTGAAHMGIILNTMYEVNPYPGVVLRYESNYNCVFCIDMSDKTNVCPPEETFEYKIIKNNITNQTHSSTVTLFGGYDGNGDLWRFDTCKIYYCKIYDHGTLVRDLIPVRAGQVGYMYDKVTRQLFGNIGTGSFILGPDVSMPYDAEIQYLQGDGNSYILTNVNLTNNTGVITEIKYCMPTKPGSETWVMGSWDSNRLPYLIGYYGGNYRAEAGPDNSTYWGSIAWDNKFHIARIDTSGTYFDGSVKASTALNNVMNITNIPLFKSYHVNTAVAKQIAYCKIWNLSGALIRDFISVRVGTTGYLYDKITETLFGNSGTGSFTIGPDV